VKTEHVQTKVALLSSAGYNHKKWTWHTYSHSEVVNVVTDGKPIIGLGHFFRCSETNEPRRWGLDRTFAKDNGGN
jgi:hypothetical protein